MGPQDPKNLVVSEDTTKMLNCVEEHYDGEWFDMETE
jgi:hypothetical protein